MADHPTSTPWSRASSQCARWFSIGGLLLSGWLAGCGSTDRADIPTLNWYVFDERSGAFSRAAERCSNETLEIRMVPLPADADQQREQLARRLAAGDPDIDLIGMDVIWTAEFAEAGWILPWAGEAAETATAGRLVSAMVSSTYRDRVWAAPFTTNTQLLWYRADRVPTPPTTWQAMVRQAEGLGRVGTIEAQGERYEGLTVLFVSLLASAGGKVLSPDGTSVSLAPEPTRAALRTMRRLARSPAASPGLSTTREDQARLAFETGDSSFMLNYTFVWPSAQANAPEVARHMRWSRWPGVIEGRASRVTIGGINIGVAAHSRHPRLAFLAASCIASEGNQRLAAVQGGMPPTLEHLYQDPEVVAAFPFAETLRDTLRDAVQRPQTPFYSDVSLAISRTLHPMSDIQPERDAIRLRQAVERALRSEGLL